MLETYKRKHDLNQNLNQNRNHKKTGFNNLFTDALDGKAEL